MKKLSIIFKAIFNFFKKNIISVISLFTLIFASSGVFTTLNNTTNNLKTSYNKIVTEGNLHNFVVNEYYVTGICKYKVYDTNGNEIDLKIDTIPNVVILKPYNWTDGNLQLLNEYQNWVALGKPDWSNGDEQQKYNYNIFTTYADELSGEYQLTLQKTDNNERINEINVKINLFISNITNMSYNFLQNNFINALAANNLPVVTRVFESMNLTTNKQNLYYKIIEQAWDESIDKIVLYSGHGFSNPDLAKWNNFNVYYNLIQEIKSVGYDNATTEQKENSKKLAKSAVYNLSLATWSESSIKNNYVKLFTYLSNNDADPYFETISGHKNATDNLKKIINEKAFYDKDFGLTINITSGLAPTTAVLTNKRSYEAIVNPEYLKSNNKEVYPYEEWKKYISSDEEKFNEWFSNLSSKYKVQIDNTELIILGTGLSPDFMYPIVALDKPLPNLKNEVLLYLNDNGYDNIKNAFRNVTTENMLLGRFTSNVNKEEVINKINEISKKYMNWPTGIKAAFLYDDTNNTMTPSAARLVFIPKIVSAIDGIASVLLLFISFVAFLVCFILIKRFVDKNKVDIGILLANGYKKWNVLLPLTLLFIAVIFVASMIGFLLGFWLQDYAMLLFTNFWTIPTLTTLFNPITFSVFIFVISIVFAIVIYLVSSYTLKGDATLLIDNNSANRINKFAILTKKAIIGNNPMNKLRMAIASSSLFKLLTLGIMGGLLLSVFTFSIASTDKFKESYNKTFNAKNYSYSIDMYTPTVQGGQYMTIPYNSYAMTTYGIDGWENPYSENYQLAQYIYDGPYTNISSISSNNQMDKDYLSTRGYSNAKGEAKKLLGIYGNYQIPSSTDAEIPLIGNGDLAASTELQYLSYFVQSKLILSASIAGNRPWDIAIKLMPTNQRVACENAARDILSLMTADTTNEYMSMKSSLIGGWSDNGKKTFQEGIYKYVSVVNNPDDIKNDSNVFENLGYDSTSSDSIKKSKYLRIEESKIVSGTALSQDYLSLMMTAFSLDKYAVKNYLMGYKKIPVMEGDKTYSYALFNINDSSLSEQKIIGVSDRNKDFLNLVNDNNEDLEYKLLNYDVNSSTIPVIVNKSGLKKMNLRTGDTFSVTVNNTVDRLTRGSTSFNIWDTPIGKNLSKKDELKKKIIVDEDGIENSSDYIKNKYTFKIIDVLDTYEGVEMYTTQNYVNLITGMAIFDTSDYNGINGEKIGVKGVPFNGIFTQAESPFQITNSIQFYSPVGLNIGNDKLEAGLKSALPYKVKKNPNFIKDKYNYDVAKQTIGYTGNASDIDTFASDVVRHFGDSAYVSIATNVYPTDIIRQTFSVMDQTIYTIQLFAVSLMMIICFILIILITFVLISDSIKTASLLKALGFNDINNSLSLMTIYVPVLIIGILLSIPLTILFTYYYVEIIFSFSGILLSVPLLWWQFLISALSIVLVFVVASCSIFYQLKRKKLSNEIK